MSHESVKYFDSINIENKDDFDIPDIYYGLYQNIIAISLAYLVVGVVVVEVVFIYPGLGQLMVDSVSNRDIPVVQACAMIFAGTYILLNLTADIVSICTNPRLLHPK